MIIPLNIKSENTYYKIFKAVNIAFARLNSNTENTNSAIFIKSIQFYRSKIYFSISLIYFPKSLGL